MSMYRKYLWWLRELDPTAVPEGPYSNAPMSKWFVKVPYKDEWRPRRNNIGNGITQDLLRLVDSWYLEADSRTDSAGPGSYHAEGGETRVDFEDGGLEIEVSMYEDQNNNLRASQKTRILGRKAKDRLFKGLRSAPPVR